MNIDWNKRDIHIARDTGLDRLTVAELRKRAGVPAFRRGPIKKTRSNYPEVTDKQWESWTIRQISLNVGVSWVTAKNLKQNRD